MEHTLPIDSNLATSSRLINSKIAGSSVASNQIEISDFLPAHELELADSIEITLQPLNFDNQVELGQARDFLKMLEVEKPDWNFFVPMSEADDERVFVSEFLSLNGKLVGLVAIEMTSSVEALNSRVAVMSCLLDLESIEIHIDIVQDFISSHLSHLSERQGWRDLQLGSISSFSSISEFQQF